MKRWHPQSSPEETTARTANFLNNLQRIPRHMPAGHLWTAFRTISNAANTSRRFQQRILPCIWCNTPEQDAIDHLPSCPSIPYIINTHLPHLRGVSLTTDIFFMTTPLHPLDAGSVVCLHDLLNSGIVARLHTGHPFDPHTTIIARARATLRRHPALHNCFRIG